jgi:hypothetical protein
MNLYRFGALFLIAGLTLYLTACGTKAIPYSQNTDALEPNEVAVAHYNWGMQSAQIGFTFRDVPTMRALLPILNSFV